MADRYVDNIASGADSSEERERQLEETRSCLAVGRFSLKFVAKSGNPPPEGTSSDNKTVSCLGMAWETKEDLLGPMMAPMNLQRKVRGQKAAPECDITTQEDQALALGAQARHTQTSTQNLLGSLARNAAGQCVIPDLAAAARGSTGQFLPVRQVPASYVDKRGERRAARAPCS